MERPGVVQGRTYDEMCQKACMAGLNFDTLEGGRRACLGICAHADSCNKINTASTITTLPLGFVSELVICKFCREQEVFHDTECPY